MSFGRGSSGAAGLKIFSLECRSDHTSIDLARENVPASTLRAVPMVGRPQCLNIPSQFGRPTTSIRPSVVLQDVSAALDYACRIVRELSAKGYNDPGLLVSVRKEMREIVLSVPFLAACD
jgi:hypothetical protein